MSWSQLLLTSWVDLFHDWYMKQWWLGYEHLARQPLFIHTCAKSLVYLFVVFVSEGGPNEKRYLLQLRSVICHRQEISRFTSLSQWTQATSRARQEKEAAAAEVTLWDSAAVQTHISGWEKGGTVVWLKFKRWASGGGLVTAELLYRQTAWQSESSRTGVISHNSSLAESKRRRGDDSSLADTYMRGTQQLNMARFTLPKTFELRSGRRRGRHHLHSGTKVSTHICLQAN